MSGSGMISTIGLGVGFFSALLMFIERMDEAGAKVLLMASLHGREGKEDFGRIFDRQKELAEKQASGVTLSDVEREELRDIGKIGFAVELYGQLVFPLRYRVKKLLGFTPDHTPWTDVQKIRFEAERYLWRCLAFGLLMVAFGLQFVSRFVE